MHANVYPIERTFYGITTRRISYSRKDALMPSVLARIFLFLSSYAPLSAMLVLLFWNRSALVAWGCGILAVVSVIGMLTYLTIVEQITSAPGKILDSHARGDEAMSYIVTYIIPFLAVAFSDWQQALALIVFFIMLGFLYVNSDMLHINPTLNFFRFRIYEVTLEDGSTYHLIARGRVQRGSTLQLVRVGDEILFEKRR